MSLLYIERSRSALFRPHKHQINTNATAYLLWCCYIVGVIFSIAVRPAYLVHIQPSGRSGDVHFVALPRCKGAVKIYAQIYLQAPAE